MIKLGSTDITNVMLGTTKVDAIFLGNTKVYPNLPVMEGVYVYHVDKKFYTFPEFQKLSNTNISQVLGFAIIVDKGAFLLPPKIVNSMLPWAPENFDEFLVPGVGSGLGDLDGQQNTNVLWETFRNVAGSTTYAAGFAATFKPVPIGGSWYLPSIGEVLLIKDWFYVLNDYVYDTFYFRYFPYADLWTSTQDTYTNAYAYSYTSDNTYSVEKVNNYVPFPVIKLG